MKQSIETRHDLGVPFAEKDAAKALGARWDAERKTWWATLRTLDQNPRLGQWLPDGVLRRKCLEAAEWLARAEPREVSDKLIRFDRIGRVER